MYRGLTPHKITPMSGVLHTEPFLGRASVLCFWYGPGEPGRYSAQIMNYILTLLCLSLVALVALGCSRKEDAMRAHMQKHKTAMIADTATLIDQHGDAQRISADELPESLLFPGTRFAETRLTHVNVITYSNPDTVGGYRVWLNNPSDEYADRPTSSPNVTRFRYCNDLPESPENRY